MWKGAGVRISVNTEKMGIALSEPGGIFPRKGHLQIRGDRGKEKLNFSKIVARRKGWV